MKCMKLILRSMKSIVHVKISINMVLIIRINNGFEGMEFMVFG